MRRKKHSSSVFRLPAAIRRRFALSMLFAGECEMLAAEPPGHGTNQTSAIEDLEELTDLYKQELNLRPDRPFVLFGHSMGGMITFRLAQKLEREGVFPQAVIISAIQPPHIQRKKVSHLPDDQFLDHIIQLGGMPAELVENKEVMSFFLPSFRSDYRALEQFELFDLTRSSRLFMSLTGLMIKNAYEMRKGGRSGQKTSHSINLTAGTCSCCHKRKKSQNGFLRS